MSEKINKIAIDIGYGYTKVKTENKEFKFPTAVALARTQMVDIEDLYIFEGKKYLVGEDALRNALVTRDYEFIYKYAPLLIIHAINVAELDVSINKIEVNTGLSLYDLEKKPLFDNTSTNRKEEFKNRISKFVVNDIQYDCEISLFAQGQGVWFDYCNDNGIIENGYDVIIDIGYRTNDVVIFKDGTPSKANSSADDKGVNEITTELQTILNKRFDIVFTEQEINVILKEKFVSIAGAKKDLTNTINEVIDNFFENFINSLKAKHGNILKIAQRVVFSGGGAYIIEMYKNELPSNVVFSSSPMEFANVRGYFNGK